MKPSKEKVILNIGGLRYETYASTLQTFPGTKLCSLTDPQAAATFDYDPETKAFFFDRSSSLFEEVLNYYRTKRLHCPDLTCKAVLDEELAFWGLSNTPLAPCCWPKLVNAEGREEEEDLLREEDRGAAGLLDPAESIQGSWRGRWQPRIWTLFERPFSSLSAKCLAVMTLLFNVGICVIFIAKAYEEGQIHYLPAHHWEEAVQDHEVHPHETNQGFSYLIYLEFFCVLWFTLEFCLRFTFCPKKKKFLKNPLNLADFLSLFPVFIELALKEPNVHLLSWLGFFRALYFVKLLKVLKLVETPVMLKVLSYTSRAILREMVILLMVFLFEILFFGTLCYFADFIEDDSETLFDSIGSSFWWAVITLTTVGYGDFYPNSLVSKLIGACAAFCGVLTIITPIPLFFIKFKGYYDAVMIQEKKKDKQRQAPALPLH